MSSASSKPIIPSTLPDWLPQGRSNLHEPAESGPFDLLLHSMQTLPKCGTPSPPREESPPRESLEAPGSCNPNDDPIDSPPAPDAADGEIHEATTADQPETGPVASDQAEDQDENVAPEDSLQPEEETTADPTAQSLAGALAAAATITVSDEVPATDAEVLAIPKSQPTVF